jgi:tetratricopeptide (TPR) repeat protein
VWNRLPASFRAEREFVHARAGMYHALAAASHHDLRLTRGYANQYLAVITTLAERDPADPDLRYELSLAHIELGWTLWALGDPVATAGHYRKAIELREQLVKERPADMVYRRSLMLAYEHFAAVEGGGSVNSLGKPDIARTYYEKAMPLAETAAADTANKLASEDYALLILRSAAVDAPAERIPASLASLRRSAAMFESLRRASNDRTKYAAYLATAHEFIGNRQLDSGGYPEAIASYEHAQALAAGVPASDITHREASRSAFECEIGIARAMALAGNRSGALAHSAMSIRMAGRSAPTDADQSILKSPDAQAYLALADVYRTFEEWVPAREAAERALASASPLPAGNAWSPNAGIFHEAEALIAECVSRSDTR